MVMATPFYGDFMVGGWFVLLFALLFFLAGSSFCRSRFVVELALEFGLNLSILFRHVSGCCSFLLAGYV